MAKKKEEQREPPPRTARMDDFWMYGPSGEYFYMPTRALWAASTIQKILPKEAVDIINNTRRISTMTWIPGEPTIIRDRGVFEGGWYREKGLFTFNGYRAPMAIGGDAGKAGMWIEQVEFMFGDYAQHIIKWLAFKVQNPGKKINHALVLGSSAQGIGKDAVLAPLKRAVGSWNFGDIGARQVFADVKNNGYLEKVLLRINEAHDFGQNRHAFYDFSKNWMAAPPETLAVADKWVPLHPVFNVVGVIITTNHKTDGLYLPREDRRHYVAWSQRETGERDEFFWKTFFHWGEHEDGFENVARYLATLDLSDFDPHAPPEKTPAFWAMVTAGEREEDSNLADALDSLAWDGPGTALEGVWDEPHRPDAVTLDMIHGAPGATTELRQLLGDRKGRTQIPHRMESAGYSPVRNPTAKDGYWNVGGRADHSRRIVVYARNGLGEKARQRAAAKLVERLGREAESTRAAIQLDYDLGLEGSDFE